MCVFVVQINEREQANKRGKRKKERVKVAIEIVSHTGVELGGQVDETRRHKQSDVHLNLNLKMDPHFRRAQETSSTLAPTLVSDSGGGSGGASASLLSGGGHNASGGAQVGDLEQRISVSLECFKTLLIEQSSAALALIDPSADIKHGGHEQAGRAANSNQQLGNRFLVDLNTLEGYNNTNRSLVKLATNETQPLGQGKWLDLVQLERKLPAIQSAYALEALNEHWQLVLVICYSLTAITSFILNIITVIVLARCQRSELRKYLINLSLSDLLMSLFSIRK